MMASELEKNPNSMLIDCLRHYIDLNAPDMTKDQKRHLLGIELAHVVKNVAKYYAGTKEHPGLLLDIDVLQQLYNISDEILDAGNYVESAIAVIENRGAPAIGRGLDF